ncbi:MAG TPA: hypothetical protein VNM68_13545 [Candidatus Polarisedimenticolia bacterium]|nr:hypothetical protein [Candidatus Polarisedimenticolia bacterium]
MLLAVGLCLIGRWACAPRVSAQDIPGAPTEEIVANLAAGRVVIAVVKNAILVATVEEPLEAETRPPTPVALASERLGVMLGAVEWWSPSSQQEIARLDKELPHLRSLAVTTTPHLGQSQGGDEATDIEAIGKGLLSRLNEVAEGLHGKVNSPANEPIAELIVADYLTGYGPEVWQLAYRIKQEEQRAEYWTTRVLPPAYLQFWPPEKNQPRTLVEFHYPPENAPPSLLDLLRGKDPRLEKIRSSDAKMAGVADRLLAGESNKVSADDATQFLRAALDAIAPPQARETMAMIRPETGFAWVLPPPEEPTERRQPERPSNAPTLAKPPQR